MARFELASLCGQARALPDELPGVVPEMYRVSNLLQNGATDDEGDAGRLPSVVNTLRRVERGSVMSFRLVHRDECETAGNWSLFAHTRRAVIRRQRCDVPPGGQIPEHDETERDQEELFTSSAAANDRHRRR